MGLCLKLLSSWAWLLSADQAPVHSRWAHSEAQTEEAGEALLMERADAQKRHTETHDVSKSLGLNLASTTGFTHISLTKALIRGRGNAPLLLQEHLQSHIQAEYGYQEGQELRPIIQSITHSGVKEGRASHSERDLRKGPP